VGLFTLFFHNALRIKKDMRKARNAAGVAPRQGFATPRMAFLAATGNGLKTAPLVVALLGQTPSLAVVVRLDWRCFQPIRILEKQGEQARLT